MPGFSTQPCPRSEWDKALRLLFTRIDEHARDEHVHQVQLSAASGSVDLSGLLVCHRDSEVVGVMLGIESTGRAFMSWPPVVAAGLTDSDRDAAEDSLMSATHSLAVQRNSRFAQILLGPDDRDRAPLLLRHSYFHLTRLNYLRRQLFEGPLPPLRTDVKYQVYRPQLHEAFLDALQSSYEGSLDCPELTGLREIQEVFDSHKAQGRFTPNHWLLAQKEGTTVGCLLLAGLPEYDALEIAYVAVLPHARGQGLGRELTRKALFLGETAGVQLISLAVDVRNDPAQRVYRAEGFAPWDERDAYLLLLDPADGKFDRSGRP